MPQIILQFLPYLFQAGAAVPKILEFIKKTREHLQQNGEWTPEMEAEYAKSLDDMEKDPAWKPETKGR